MSYQHSCFISYRHTKEYKGQSYTERIVDDLKAELEIRVAQGVYRDRDRLKGAEFYNEALATAICQSVCMVVLYWPTYFDQSHLFCAREFRAMEDLERRRLQLLPQSERVHGLIIVLALRDFDQIPAAIKARRMCKDFEAYTLKPNLRRDPRFQADVLEIGGYIAARCRAFDALPPATFASCGSFKLPSERDVQAWVQRVAVPALPFANREIRQ
jgi:hypothetical protein